MHQECCFTMLDGERRARAKAKAKAANVKPTPMPAVDVSSTDLAARLAARRKASLPEATPCPAGGGRAGPKKRARPDTGSEAPAPARSRPPLPDEYATPVDEISLEAAAEPSAVPAPRTTKSRATIAGDTRSRVAAAQERRLRQLSGPSALEALPFGSTGATKLAPGASRKVRRPDLFTGSSTPDVCSQGKGKASKVEARPAANGPAPLSPFKDSSDEELEVGSVARPVVRPAAQKAGVARAQGAGGPRAIAKRPAASARSNVGWVQCPTKASVSEAAAKKPGLSELDGGSQVKPGSAGIPKATHLPPSKSHSMCAAPGSPVPAQTRKGGPASSTSEPGGPAIRDMLKGFSEHCKLPADWSFSIVAMSPGGTAYGKQAMIEKRLNSSRVTRPASEGPATTQPEPEAKRRRTTGTAPVQPPGPPANARGAGTTCTARKAPASRPAKAAVTSAQLKRSQIAGA